MAANQLPIFPKTLAVGIANISAANANRTVTGVTGLVSVLAAGAEGSRLDRITIQATATTTAGMIRLWLYSGSGDAQLWKEVPVTAATPSATVQAFSYELDLSRELLPVGYSLYASTNNADAFNVIAFGGAY